MAPACIDGPIQYIRAADGVDVPVRVFGPDGGKLPVLMLHGIQSHSGWFARSAAFMASLGHPVYSFDRRGSGASRETRGHAARYQDLVDEAQAVVAALERQRARRVHVLGHCFGAIPATLFACCHRAMVESLVLTTPGIHARTPLAPATCLQIAVLRVLRPTQPIPFPLYPEDLADLDADRKMIRDDPLSLHELTAGFLFESFRACVRAKRRMRRLTTPLFVALAARDRILDNRRTMALFHRIPSESKRLMVYSNATHILEFSEEKDAFFRDLSAWLAGGYSRAR